MRTKDIEIGETYVVDSRPKALVRVLAQGLRRPTGATNDGVVVEPIAGDVIPGSAVYWDGKEDMLSTRTSTWSRTIVPVPEGYTEVRMVQSRDILCPMSKEMWDTRATAHADERSAHEAMTIQGTTVRKQITEALGVEDRFLVTLSYDNDRVRATVPYRVLIKAGLITPPGWLLPDTKSASVDLAGLAVALDVPTDDLTQAFDSWVRAREVYSATLRNAS